MNRWVIAEDDPQGNIETGSQPAFAPAGALFASCGFGPGAAIGVSVDQTSSIFMTRQIEADPPHSTSTSG